MNDFRGTDVVICLLSIAGIVVAGLNYYHRSKDHDEVMKEINKLKEGQSANKDLIDGINAKIPNNNSNNNSVAY